MRASTTERLRRRIAASLALASAVAVVVTVAGALPLACRSREFIPPDVLVITVDTLRADHLGSYGFGFDTSPNIDALARESVVFEKAIAAAGKTAPAHASIMTSRYTREHTIGHGNGTTSLAGETTLAERFRDAGYATAAVVSNILLTRRVGLDRGFEVFDDELTAPDANRPHVLERLAPDATERALAWLNDSGEQPFFLWVHYQDPHGPYTPPPELRDRFQIPGPAGEEELPLRRRNSAGGGVPAYQVLPGLKLASEYRGRYAGEIFFADRSIGTLLAAADAASAERGRDIIVLLTADHGESFGEHGHYFKHTHTTTPDVARVPLILRAPGRTPERRNEVVSHVDILPTLLDLARLPPPQGASGVTLEPLLGEPERRLGRYVYCDNGGQLSAYDEGGFFWMVGVGSAWRRASGESRAPFAASWAHFRSAPSGRWVRNPDEVPLPAEIDAYARRATVMNPLPPPTDAEVDRLRALGYVD